MYTNLVSTEVFLGEFDQTSRRSTELANKMQVFSRKFFVTVIIWLQTMVSVYCQQDELECHFDVKKDEREVEKVVVEYLHNLNVQMQPTRILDSLLEILPFALNFTSESPSSSESSEETTDLDICHQSKEDKLTACAEILRLNYFGLVFQPNDTEMACSTQEISFKHSETVHVANTCTTLFQCPQLGYTDLETDNTVVVSTTYFISNVHLENSFVLYYQDGPNPAIYPHKLASRVRLEEFHWLRYVFGTIQTRDRIEAGNIKKIDEVPGVMEQLSRYLGIRKTEKVYDKFQNLFNNLSVCALPRTHLIAVCRYVARDIGMTVQHQGFKSQCENQAVFAPTDASAEPGSDFIDTIPLAKCPVIYTPRTKDSPFKNLTIFLSAYLHRNSAITYQVPNRQPQKIVPSAVITSMELQMLQKDTNRRREFLMPEIGSPNENGDC